MPSNPKRSGTNATNSFRADEVLAVNQLCRALRRGGDVRALIRSEAFRRLEAKFVRMETSIKERRSGVEVVD